MQLRLEIASTNIWYLRSLTNCKAVALQKLLVKPKMVELIHNTYRGVEIQFQC